MTFKKSEDFKLEVILDEAFPDGELIEKYFDFEHAIKISPSTVKYVYVGSWVNMRYLARLFEIKHKAKPIIKYQGKYSEERS